MDIAAHFNARTPESDLRNAGGDEYGMSQPVENPLARVLNGLFKALGIGWHKHHMVPREILKLLPKEVADHPQVRGVKGSPNRWCIPIKTHKALHEGARGGEYNEFWKKRLNTIESEPTVENVLRIKNDAIQVFKLEKYAPK